MSTDYNSRIKWLDKIVDFIDSQEPDGGLEAFMKQRMANLLTTLQLIIKKAGEQWLQSVTAKVIAVNTEDIPGAEKLKKVLTAMKDETIATVQALSDGEATMLVNAVVSDLKVNGIIR